MLAERYVEAGSDDDRRAGPSRAVGEITEDQITEDRSPDQLDIASRGEGRRRAADFERAIGNVRNNDLSLVEPIAPAPVNQRRSGTRD